jgi:DNA replicative helicase MCM subunit Mcm2 (Cdc46/Mcm family)
MSAWLLDKCIAYAKAHRHPELTEQTIWECQLAWSSVVVSLGSRLAARAK